MRPQHWLYTVPLRCVPSFAAAMSSRSWMKNSSSTWSEKSRKA